MNLIIMRRRVVAGWLTANSQHFDVGGFRVLYIKKGEKSPNRPVTADKDALIEFYDLKHKHTPDGQFIADYDVQTILEGESGLDLHGGVPSWKVSASDMKKVREWVTEIDADTAIKNITK